MLFYTGMLSDAFLEFSMNGVPVGLFFMATAALLAFSRNFLDVKSIDKKLVDGINYLIYVALALFFLSTFKSVSVILEDFAFVFVILVSSALLGLCIFLSLMKNKVYAYFYLFGFSSIFLTTLFAFSSHFDLVSLGSSTVYLFELSILFEAAVFSFAISYKHKETILELEKNEYLYKELSHRVSNNLQSIIALISSQQRRSKNIKLKENLQDVINRVRTTALIYKMLQDTQGLGKANMSEYLHKLISLSKDENENLEFTVNCDSNILMDEEPLTILSRIITELITNSMKHAFTNIDEPKISLSFEENEKGYLFTYEDNGNGFETAEPSLGTKLIDRYTNLSLNGQNTIDSQGKYLFTLSFPKK